MKASELKLVAGPALDAALAIEAGFPGTVFTSGLRDEVDQARAMSQNIVHNRNWINQTYRPSAAASELQTWVTANKAAQSAEVIATGLLSVMHSWDTAMKRKLSRHFSGEAFDIAPVAGKKGEAMKAFIHKLPGIKFLEEEGGLIRWHVQSETI